MSENNHIHSFEIIVGISPDIFRFEGEFSHNGYINIKLNEIPESEYALEGMNLFYKLLTIVKQMHNEFKCVQKIEIQEKI